jgi:hypothetical protein
MRVGTLCVIVVCVFALLSATCFGQEGPKLGVGAGFGASSLGYHFDGALAVTKQSNFRGGFNFLNYNRDTHKDGIDYAAQLGLRSLQFTYEQYIYKGLHVGGGVLAYNGNHGDGTAAVPVGQSFSLGNARYFSSASNPIRGTARVDLGHAAPLLVIGVGNPIPRSTRRVGFYVDGGIAFQGSPKSTLALSGSACAINPTLGCVNAATDPTVQANVLAEQKQINDDLNFLKYYPILSFGITWKIK